MTINPALLGTVARYYGAMVHAPDCQPVAHAYTVLCAELWRQFEDMTDFIGVGFTDKDPYTGSMALFQDINQYGLFRVYTGGADLPAGHPLARTAPNGQTYNTIFRAVHDGLAHYPIRASFSVAGELQAFERHYRMLSPLAGHAIATETLGQNAWFNFGPHADLPVRTRPYAPQKATLLPLSLINEVLAQ